MGKDEEEISAAFGCTSFDEVAQKAGLEDRAEVVKMLGSSDINAFHDLAQRAEQHSQALRGEASDFRVADNAGAEYWQTSQQLDQGKLDEASYLLYFSWLTAPCCASRPKSEEPLSEPLLMNQLFPDPATP